MTKASKRSDADIVENEGRRAQIVEYLRTESKPLSVEAVAKHIGVHINTARFHLETLVDAGKASRMTEVRTKPGRRRVLYSPSETRPRIESIMDSQLMTMMLTAAIATHYPDTRNQMYEVGEEWGRYLTTRPAPYEVFDEANIQRRLLDKVDSLWFGPEVEYDPEPTLRMRSCPFMELARRAPNVVCQVHCGVINGSLELMGSSFRVYERNLDPETGACYGRLLPADESRISNVRLKTPSLAPQSA